MIDNDDFFVVSIVDNKIVLEVKQAAIDKGPYAIIMTLKATNVMQGSITIPFDLTKKKSTAFTYAGGANIVLDKTQVVSEVVELTAGAEHPNDKEGTFTMYPAFPAGLTLIDETGEIDIKGTPPTHKISKKYPVTYTPHADNLDTHAKYTTEISIKIKTISYERKTYTIPTGSAVSRMTIQATSLKGTYAIELSSVLPKGLYIDTAKGEIREIPTKVAIEFITVQLTPSDSSLLIETTIKVTVTKGLPTKDTLPPIVETTIKVTVTQGDNYIGGYADISGKVNIALRSPVSPLNPTGIAGNLKM